MAREDSLLENLKKMAGRMNANYQPIVIKMLLEDPQHTITIQNIRKKFDELNFGRANFISTDGGNPMGNSAIKSVREALRNFVKFPEGTSNGNVTLIEKMYDEKTKDECLKICGQKIADWHIKEITKFNYEMWHILPGSRDDGFPYLDEFIKTNTIGVGWDKIRDISNLSDLEIEKTFEKYYDKGLGSFQSFTEIKPKDIVVLTRGQEEIIDFGIVTSDYEFHDVVKPSYPHRKNIVWLNQGPILASELPRQSLSFIIATCGKLDKRKQEMLDVLSNTNIKQQDNQKYFILTQNVDSEYKDTDKQYHFKKGRPGSGQLTNNGKNAKFIIQSKIEGQNYFVGHGIIGTFSEKTPKNNEGVDIIANYSTYEKFEKPKIRTENVHHQMKSSSSYGGRPPAILPIPRSLYVKIIGEDLTSKEDGIDTMSMDNYERALEWKPNLILYGPPGTGKTYHATKIATKLVLKNKIKPNNVKKISVEQKIAQIMLENNGLALDLEEIVNKIIENEPNRNSSELLLHVQNILNGDDMVGKENLFYKKYGDKKYGLNLPFEIKKSFRFVLFANSAPMYQQAIVDECKKREILPTKWNWNNRNGDGEFDKDESLKERSNFIFTDDKYSLRNYNYFEDALNVKNTFIKKVTFHPSYSYEDFVEGFRPNVKDAESNVKDADKEPYVLENGIFKQICIDAQNDDNPDNKYVIIIDEINRGNIPKIFGELITLIEDDKRYTEYSLQLTYSKNSFFVPKNLIIIGTMNTADKSLMQMDDALKRRFVFEELMPDTDFLLEHLTGKKIPHAAQYCDILKRINGKILGEDTDRSDEKIKQFRDRQIGHSYFLKIKNDKDLQTVIKYDIIPLLQDYFYGDYSEIQKIFSKNNNNDPDYKDNLIIGDDNRPTTLVTHESESSLLRDALLKI